MKEINIRLATKQDLPILNHFYADMDEKPLMSEAEITAIWNQIEQVPNHYIYLACLEDKEIGTFSLLFMPTMMHRGFHRSAILDSVTISTAYWQKGFGKQMMQKALKISFDAGCYKVTLSSNLKRERAHKFYESLGFKQHGWSFSYSNSSR
ncbi:GNAT family N-acetyltransferase [Pleurocapsa sp. FMAR1]|uniref:GNAT family N-acetyltransferase n=1 Tax=Pleurocapsa sp. FMAR1 TaxID=3040204 RepID=UPI0029C7372A|nr:GNAT family N-acetyltransferase [Pleurocapsa sp. FMAR1]